MDIYREFDHLELEECLWDNNRRDYLYSPHKGYHIKPEGANLLSDFINDRLELCGKQLLSVQGYPQSPYCQTTFFESSSGFNMWSTLAKDNLALV